MNMEEEKKVEVLEEEQENVQEEVQDETTKKKKKLNKKETELENFKKENALLNDKILRISAELQNYKRRAEEQISNMAKYEGESLIKELLAIVDNFERAINMDDTNLEDEVSKFLSGFKMIYVNLDKIMKKQGVEEIDCLNKEFDPNTMEAVLTDKVEGINANTVIDVLQKGYTYRGKVIRHAMVKVAE